MFQDNSSRSPRLNPAADEFPVPEVGFQHRLPAETADARVAQEKDSFERSPVEFQAQKTLLETTGHTPNVTRIDSAHGPLSAALAAPGLQIDYGPGYEIGRWLAEHGQEIAAFATDPTNLGLSAAALGSAGITVALGAKLGVRGLRSGWNSLHGHPGEVRLGVRREKPYDYILDPPVGIRFEDARKGGLVLVGPTGQGKTTAAEIIAIRALLWGQTVVMFESDGDLGLRLLARSRDLGIADRTFYFDPSVQGAMKWNPLSGDVNEVVRQAVDTIESVSTSNHEFYRDFNKAVMRNMTRLACAYAAHSGAEATIKLVLLILTDQRLLEKRILNVTKNEVGEVEIRAPFVRGELKTWLEQEFLSWSPRLRGEYLVGLRNLLAELLPDERVMDALCPKSGDSALDLQALLNSGGLIVFRTPSDAVGQSTAQTLLTWGLQKLQQETLSRKAPRRPVWAMLDEAHVVLGEHNTAAARSYSRWFVQVRRFNVAPILGYQSFYQLPDSLRKVLDASARNKLVFGGMHGDDAEHAQDLLGHTVRRKKEVREVSSGGPFAPVQRQTVTRSVEEPYYSLSEIENLPQGCCFYRGVRGAYQLPPAKVRIDRRSYGHAKQMRVRNQGHEQIEDIG